MTAKYLFMTFISPIFAAARWIPPPPLSLPQILLCYHAVLLSPRQAPGTDGCTGLIQTTWLPRDLLRVLSSSARLLVSGL